MAEHTLKCWDNYFDAVASGEKTFEVRRDDRGFQKGDLLILEKIDRFGKYLHPVVHPEHGYFVSPQQVRRRISYVLTGGQFGIDPGYVVLGLQKPAP